MTNKNIKILVLDNYDSFTYNLVHYIRELGFTNLEVFRNDKISLKDVDRYDKILLSPGPGIPDESGILKEIIRTYGKNKSIMGVCLGHQAIGEVYGAELENRQHVLHGIANNMQIVKEDVIYSGLPDQFLVGRYHSWQINKEKLGDQLLLTATDDQGCVMSIRHKEHDVCGVQFHPESILTEHGKDLMKNWLES